MSGWTTGRGQVQGLVEVLDERDRPTRNQPQMDAVPVLVGRVLDQRPALQVRLRAEQQAVGDLPQGRLGDVADAHVPPPRPRKAQRHRPPLVVRAGRQRRQGLAQLAVQTGVPQLDPRNIVQPDRLQAVRRRAGSACPPSWCPSGPSRSSTRRRRPGRSACPCAVVTVTSAPRRWFSSSARLCGWRDVNGERLQGPPDGVARAVDDRLHLAVRVDQCQRLQDVVDLGRAEGQGHDGVARDRAAALDVGDARREQCHLPDGQRARNAGVGAWASAGAARARASSAADRGVLGFSWWVRGGSGRKASMAERGGRLFQGIGGGLFCRHGLSFRPGGGEGGFGQGPAGVLDGMIHVGLGTRFLMEADCIV